MQTNKKMTSICNAKTESMLCKIISQDVYFVAIKSNHDDMKTMKNKQKRQTVIWKSGVKE